MHSFYSFEYVLKLPIPNVSRLLSKAFEKQTEEKAFQLYVAKYPWMDEESYIPFDKFYNPKKEIETEQKSEAEILSEVKGILDSYKGGD